MEPLWLPRLRFPRLRFSGLPRLLAAAVLVGCCARLCRGTGSTLATAIPCARLGTATGQRGQTDPERGAGTGWVPTPEAVGQLRTETEPLPSPWTPAGTAEPPNPQGSPGGPRAGGEGTGPAVVRDGAASDRPGLLQAAAGSAGQAAAGSERPSPAPVPGEPDTSPAAGSVPGTDPVGNATAEGATTPPGTPSHSSAYPRGQWGSPSTLPGRTPTGTGLAQRQGGSRGPSSPDPWAGEDPGATVPLGDTGPGTRPSIAPATESPAPGAMGTSPFGGGLQRLPSPAGTRQGTDGAWQGPRSAPRPSLPPLGTGGRGGLLASTAQPAAGTGLGLPVPTATASTPGVTSPSLGGAVGPTTGVFGPPDTEGPPEHGHVPPDQTWHPPALPGQPRASVAPGSPTAAQSGVPDASPGSPRVPPSPQPAPTSGSVAPMSPTPQPSPGTSRRVPGLSPTAGTPSAGPSPGHQLPHAGLGGDPAESPQILGGTPVGVGDAGLWAVPLVPPSAPGPPQQLGPSQPASSLGLTTATGVTASPALLRDVGTVTPEPGAAVLQGAASGLTWGPPTLSTMVPGPPQQPPGTLGHRGGPGSPPGAGNTDLVQPSSSPGGWPDADTPQATPAPAAAGRAPRVFIVEDQPPLLRAPFLRIPCELVLDMGFVPALQDPGSREHRRLLHSFNRTVAPLFTSVPGFLRLEVTGIREGSVVLEYDALFAAERVQAPGLGELLEAALGSGGARPGLAVGTAPVLRHAARERPLDPCALLFACRAGFACVAGADGNATCTSLCHRDYCKNHGICTHPRDRGPLCQCPVGSDFWFMGLRCDYRVTQQSLLGMAAGVLLSIVLLGAVVAAVVIRRFKALLLEARADQTRSSYRRFCRLDDVSAQYWSRSWLPSASSLDNPAFSNSEELLHLQILDNGCCSCREDSGVTGSAKQRLALPARPARRPSSRSDWDTSSSSVNDPMVDSGKASDISVSSWPMEPTPWTPFPLPQQLSRQRPHKARGPRSSCEGLELVTLERSWTA
ncbi:uncharacterized protein LOC141930417 [Strix aluco]|uniref:uncharacterized protein LOC141930417 n=1 Tax=Strix aluco TaxID=111821 RepID=UPI003DA57F75